MISSLLAIRRQLRRWLQLTMLAFFATALLGQGTVAANALTPVVQPIGLNVSPAAQNLLTPELIPALADWAQRRQQAARQMPPSAGAAQATPTLALDDHWLAALTSGPDAALMRPLAWRSTLLSADWQPELMPPTQPADPAVRARTLAAFGRSPLHFEPNQGQVAKDVKFLARVPGYQLYLMPDEVALALRARAADQASAVVRMQLMGDQVNRQPVLEALDALPGRSNYYLGNDPQGWQIDVPHFAKVRYSAVYPGVDWVLYGNPRQLEYDFVVAPGADPQQIALTFVGADEARIAANGELMVAVAGREVLHSSPTIYQMVDGERRLVEGRYALRAADTEAPVVGFEIAAYDPKLPLVIDPVVYFTFVGGKQDDNTGIGGDDYGYGVAVDSAGYAYITGATSTNNAKIADLEQQFPTSINAINKVFTRGTDIFITRMDIAGTIIYSTYLGGSGFDAAYGIAADSVGNAYITGYTNSSDFPVRSTADLVNEVVSGGPAITTASPLPQAQVGALYPATTFAVKSGNSCVDEVAWSLDPSTPLSNLPPSLVFDSAAGVLNAGTPTAAEVGTYQFIVVAKCQIPGANGLITVSGRKTFNLVILGFFQGNFTAFQGGTQDAFVAKISATGFLGYSFYLGGARDEAGFGITVDSLGQALVTGYTSSPDFPSAGVAANGEDAFIVKVNASGDDLLFSALTDFAGNDRGQGIALDSVTNNAYITGFRRTPASGRVDEAAFIGKVDGSTGAILYTAELDASGQRPVNERGLAIALDNATPLGVYITGYTTCYDSQPNTCATLSDASHPGIATTGAYDTTFNGPAASLDAFVAKYTDSLTSFALVYSTYLGGSGNDIGYGIVVDSLGNVYVAGETFSPNFPMFGPDDDNPAKSEAFLSRLDGAGKLLTYSSFWGGAENDSGRGIAKDFSNDVYLVGYTNSPKAGFTLGPITPYRDYSGGADVFVTKFSIPVINSDFNLSVKLQGSGSGEVTSIPEGIGKAGKCRQVDGILNADAVCDANYSAGTNVILTAIPEAGSLFVGWSGSGSGACTGSTVLTCNVPMTTAKVLVANFSKSENLAVTIDPAGTGTGKITSAPAGIDCGVDCSEEYPLNTPVTLTATPDIGSSFTRWSDTGNPTCDGKAVPNCIVTVSSAKTVKATFTITTPALTVSKSGSGVVTSTPTGIDCGANCSTTKANYPYGTVVTLQAAADPGFVFIGWGGACTGTSLCTLTMADSDPTDTVDDSAKTVTATFVRNFTLDVLKGGPGSGTVTSSPGGITCGVECSAGFEVNSKVTLTATPDIGSIFVKWSGACSGATATCSVTMDTVKTVQAEFSPPYQLNVILAGSGAVTSQPQGINCGTDCGENFTQNALVRLTAAPATGSVFIGWGGACATAGTTLDCTVAMSGIQDVTANFSPALKLTVNTIGGNGSGTVSSSPAGINCINDANDCAEEYAPGTQVTLTATASAGSTFTQWSGDACNGNTVPTCTVTMSAAQSMTAVFTLNVYPLTLSKIGDGTGTVTRSPSGTDCVAPETCTAKYEHGALVNLQATPDANFFFTGWGGACTGTDPCTVTMDAAKSVTATFVSNRTLTVTTVGNGKGTVTSTPTGIECVSNPTTDPVGCSKVYAFNTAVTLNATPVVGSLFVGWDGACTGASTCTVTMDTAKAVQAKFNLANELSVTVKAATGSSGVVVSIPDGIKCGADCSEVYASNTTVTLTAVPGADSVFVSWAEACASGATGTNPTCTVTIDAAKSVTAYFAPLLSVTVIKAGTGSGVVTSSPAGISCGADCSESYRLNTLITLTATAEPGSTFTGWTGACKGTGSCQLQVDDAKTVTATFQTQILTVQKTGDGSGTVASDPAGINCGTDCSEGYEQNTQVVLTATWVTGSTFTGWSGDACSGVTAPTCTVNMDASKTVSANFDVLNFTLQVKSSGNGNGIVISTPSGIDCGVDCQETYREGASVTLTATPSVGSVFLGWSGACSGVGNCVVTMNAAKTVVAIFNNTVSLQVTKSGNGSGTVTSTPSGINCGVDCQENFPQDTLVILTAAPFTGSGFTGWSEAACVGTGSCAVTMDVAKTVTATFVNTVKQPDLLVTSLISPTSGRQNTGRTVTFTLQVKNQGSAAAGRFRVGIYLSDDPIIDPATDIKTGNECLFNSLGIGVTTTCNGSFSLPKGLETGIYYLGAYADPYSAIKESDESNNSLATIDTLTLNNLTVLKTGAGGGTVTSSPSGINCGSDCATAFLADATATLTATPVTGSTFVGWDGCTPTPDKPRECKVTMSNATTVTADFGL